MIVKVKYKDILHETEKATLFLLKHEQEQWLPNSVFRYGKGRNILLQKNIAEAKELEYTSYMNIPEKINPKYNQEPINELRY